MKDQEETEDVCPIGGDWHRIHAEGEPCTKCGRIPMRRIRTLYTRLLRPVPSEANARRNEPSGR
jgi:hypothetical protein